MLVSTISTPSRSLASTLFKTGSALEARRSLATPSSSHASTSSSSSSSSATRRRSARFASRPGADMVGPPDPISNLRPVRYGSAFDSTPSTSSSSSASPSSALSMSHPYSLHEFTTPSTTSTPSLYFERLLAKLEEAELAHKLRMARADNFNQRFWQDNNARFIDALSEFRSRTTDSKAVATTRKGRKEEGKESELDLDSDSLATFYSAWLKANAKRHRAYNRQLWYQTFEDLAPAARYQGLRAWAKVVGGCERWFGRR